MARAKQLAKWLALAAVGLLVLLGLAVGLGYGYLQSEAGRERAAREIERLISTPGEIEVRIDGLAGRLPFTASIGKLQISDGTGAWLTIEKLGYEIDAAALFGATLRFRFLAADRVSLDRLPEVAATEGPGTGQPAWPTLPVAIWLERVTVGEVALGPAVLGAPASFRVDGEATSRDGSDIDASLTLVRTDGAEGRARATLRYDLADRSLDLDAQVAEPAGGLTVRALGLDQLPAVEAHLTGRGPLSDWTGELALSLEGLAQANAELRLRGGQETDYLVAGSVDMAADFDDLPWRLLRGHLDFESEGRWRAPAALAIEHARVTSPAVDLALSGTLDVENESFEGQATAQVTDPLVLSPYLPDADVTGLRLALEARGGFAAPAIAAKATAGSLALGDITARTLVAEIRTDGPLSHPRLSLDLRVGEVSAPELTGGDIAAAATFAPGADFDWEQPRGQVTTSGTIGRLDLAALPNWSPVIGQRLAWDLDAEIDAAGGRIRAAALSLETERGRLTGEGSFAWDTGAADASLQLSYPALAPLGSALGLAIAGSLEARAEIASAGPLGVLGAKVTGRLADLVVPDPFAQSLAAPTLEIAGRVARDEAGALSLTALRLASPAAIVTGEAGLDPDLSQISATYRAEIADLAVLGPAVGEPLSGSAVVTGRASGSLESPDIAGNLEVAKGSIAALPVEALTVEFTASDLPARPSGHLAASFASPAGKVTATTRYAIAEDALELTALSLAAEGLQAEGHARVPLGGAPVTLALDGRAERLSRWLALAGLEGDAKGPFRLTLSPAGPRQSGRLETTLEDARLVLAPDDSLTIEELTATIDGADLLGSASAEARLAARNLTVSDLNLAALDIEASGGPTGGDYRATAAGAWFGDLRLDTAGRVTIVGDRIEVEVSRLSGRAVEQDLALQQPARFAVDAAAMAISDLDLAFGEARLQGSARRAPDQISADITVKNLPVAALRPVVELPLADGRGDASLRLSGTAEAPRGELLVEIRKARFADLPEVPAVDLSLKGRWQDGVLSSSGRLAGLSDKDVVLSLDLPLRLDPDSLVPVVPPDRPLAGELVWQGPIDPLWDLVPADLHTLSGIGDVRVSVAGTVADPSFGGAFALRQGRYESLEAGTLLSQLEFTGDLADNRIRLARLSATDGGSGSLAASGTVEIGPDWGLSGELDAEFKDFAVIRRDDITAVAKGKLQVTGSPSESLIKGRIETDSVEVLIPDRLPPDVVELGVVEEGAAAPDGADSVDRATKPAAHRTTFDLTIDIPRRAYIRGRGIESEWAGTLKLSGSGDKMVIKGRLGLVRGQVTALGKTFRLDQGSVDFLGTAANDPTLNIVARRKTEDIEVTITVSGPLSNPKLAFSSVPELPEDELISRVLFGKTTAQLTAIEAAQLAASVAELTGRAGGAGGILGRIRTSLGVDVLRIETSDTGDSTTPDVAAGKYLTEEVYIGAKQGASADSGSAEIEVELTPNISIESEVGQQGQSKVGVKFKWDY
jgi:translocation and assembly module TamB